MKKINKKTSKLKTIEDYMKEYDEKRKEFKFFISPNSKNYLLSDEAKAKMEEDAKFRYDFDRRSYEQSMKAYIDGGRITYIESGDTW